MPRWVVPRCDSETDLVVELCRCQNVTFLLDMESHAGRTGRNAATIRSELPGDNWICVLRACANVQLPSSRWLQLANGVVPLSCWWAEPRVNANDIESRACIELVYIVLPEVFGVNAWVRVADRLAAHGHPALALPLFARTPPIWSWPMTPPIWLQGAYTRTPPPASRFLLMSPPQSAGSGLFTRRRHPCGGLLLGVCRLSGGHVARG